MSCNPRLTSSPGLRRAFSLALLVLAVAGTLPRAGDAAPRWRMDPMERERLRHELRDQAREGYPPPGPGRGHAPVIPAAPAYAPQRGDDDSGWRHAPHGGPRLSPEEREQLRMQLRERRRLRD